MRFTASHISFQEVNNVQTLALADEPGTLREGRPATYVIVSFGEEGDQERRLGMTGLYLEINDQSRGGYGWVERIDYDGETLSILGRDGREDVHAMLDTEMMSSEAIHAAIAHCNRANETRPETAQ